ncbi:MAG: cobyrinate a,c-diamide synthase, partial [Acidimicrobiales bacterium]
STTASLDLLGAAIERSVDLEALMRLASSAPPLCYDALAPAEPQASTPVRIAVAGGKAFSFVYPENLERLGEAGGEIVRFDPVSDGRLPEGTSALYAGGGFPEVFADDLAANTELLGDVRRKVASGMATWAECGGLLWLSEALGSARLCGALPTRGEMTGQLTLGYRRAIVRKDNPIAARGAELRGHEFHYSVCEPPGQAFEMTGREGTRLEGFASPTLLATYLHLHLGSAPSLAERFVKTAVSGEAPASS